MIEMVLRLKRRRLLHVNMDPGASDCRRFLSLCLDTEKMAAGFYCPEIQLLAATCWEWDEDEIDWLHRNQIRAGRLKTNNVAAVAEICHDPNKREHVCLIRPHEKVLLSQDSKLISFTEVINRLKQEAIV